MPIVAYTCPRCGAQEFQKRNALEIAHWCPKARRIVRMEPSEDE